MHSTSAPRRRDAANCESPTLGSRFARVVMLGQAATGHSCLPPPPVVMKYQYLVSQPACARRRYGKRALKFEAWTVYIISFRFRIRRPTHQSPSCPPCASRSTGRASRSRRERSSRAGGRQSASSGGESRSGSRPGTAETLSRSGRSGGGELPRGSSRSESERVAYSVLLLLVRQQRVAMKREEESCRYFHTATFVLLRREYRR